MSSIYSNGNCFHYVDFHFNQIIIIESIYHSVLTRLHIWVGDM